MINAIYNTGVTGMMNSQNSISVTTNNITNADVPGYKRQTPIYETSTSVNTNGLHIGTGADIAGIEASTNYFVEQQYLSTSADAAKYNQLVTYQMQLESVLGQSDTTGLNASLSAFFSSWSTLASDPTQPGAWEEVLSSGQGIAFTYSDTYAQMENITQSIEQEITAQVAEANALIDEIAALNAQVTANPTDLQAVDARDQAIRELSTYVNVSVEYQADGTATVLMEGQFPLVEGQESNYLSHQPAQSRESLMPYSTYTGEVAFSGTSSEEIMIEFIDDTHYYASLDGGATWVTDESGDPVVYEAGDEDNAENIAGVDVWFADDGTTSHANGDRYIITPKSGLYLEQSDGSYYNLTPSSNAEGEFQNGTATSGSIAGLILSRDDYVVPAMDTLDALAESLIWETNVDHAQGAGLEHHTSLSGTYAAEFVSEPLAESGLYFQDNLTAGDVTYVTYNADGSVSSTITVAVDPAADSLEDVAANINAASGGELVATVTSEGTLELAAAAEQSFEVAEDEANLMAGLGVNTFFTGTSAETIAVNGYVSSNPQHINAGVVNADGTVISGSNETAQSVSGLATENVEIECNGITYSEALSSFSSLLVSEVGADMLAVELKQTYAQGTNDYYYEYQLSSNGVNVDEEQINLIKYQQQYEACVKVITTARDMFDEVLDML